MSIEQILQKEIEESKRWLSRENDDSTYKRDLQKRIELKNWVLKCMKNPDIFICEIIETRMNEIIDKISRTDSIFEADPLDSELRSLDWILFQVCSNKIKRFKKDIAEDSKVTNLVLSLYKSQEHLIPNFSAFSSILIEVSCISFKRI